VENLGLAPLISALAKGISMEQLGGTFKECLSEWTPKEHAAYKLGALFGLVPFLPAYGFGTFSWMFNAANRHGDFIYDLLDGLVKAGWLEQSDENELRWNRAISDRFEADVRKKVLSLYNDPKSRSLVEPYLPAAGIKPDE
jgi:hypothetical protein